MLRNSGALHSHTVYVCSSAIKQCSAEADLAGACQTDTVYQKTATHSFKQGLAAVVHGSRQYIHPTSIVQGDFVKK